MVKSCIGLNVLRVEHGDTPKVCASPAEIIESAQSFEVSVVTVNQFFNTKKYELEKSLDWEVSHFTTVVPSIAGYVKTYQLSQNIIHYKDSWLYNWPFGPGEVITTYSTTSSDVGMVGVNNEAY